jgi:hypothetical protein
MSDQTADAERADGPGGSPLPVAPPGPVSSASLGAAIRPDYRGIIPPKLMRL